MSKFRHIFDSLMLQIIVFYLLINGVFVSLYALLSYNTVLNILGNTSGRSTMLSFKQAEASIDSFLDETDSTLRTLTTKEWAQAMISGTIDNDLERIQYMSDFNNDQKTITATREYIDSIFIINAAGDFFGIGRINTWNGTVDPNQSPLHDSILSPEKLPSFGPVVTGGHVFADLLGEQPTTKPFVTVSRLVTSIAPSGSRASLLINVRESYLASIYEQLSDGENTVFIVDAEGRVLSHTDKTLLGSQSLVFSHERRNEESGEFIFTENEIEYQIMYHTMPRYGFTIINQVPYSVFIKDIRQLRLIIIAGFVFSFFICFILFFVWIRRVTRPVTRLTKAMEQVGGGEWGMTLHRRSNDEIGRLISGFNDMSVGIDNLIFQNRQMEDQKRQIELDMLKAQINPHLLYNTLNTIKWMARMINAKNIAECATLLGNIMHQSLGREDFTCFLRDEIDHVQNYLRIMYYRMDNELRFINDIPEELLDCTIARLTLQPIVENAIVHSLSSQQQDAHIHIDAEVSDRKLLVTVRDNGRGLSRERIDELNQLLKSNPISNQPKGIGLFNVNRRICLYFGRQYGIRFLPESKGACVEISFPYISSDTATD